MSKLYTWKARRREAQKSYTAAIMKKKKKYNEIMKQWEPVGEEQNELWFEKMTLPVATHLLARRL